MPIVFGLRHRMNYREDLVDFSKIPRQLAPALEKVGHKILKDAEKTVPEDKGALKRSGYVDVTAGGKAEMDINYSARYAIVHHTGYLDGRKIHYQKPTAETRWLPNTIERNNTTYLRILAAESRRLVKEQSFKRRIGRWFKWG